MWPRSWGGGSRTVGEDSVGNISGMACVLDLELGGRFQVFICVAVAQTGNVRSRSRVMCVGVWALSGFESRFATHLGLNLFMP